MECVQPMGALAFAATGDVLGQLRIISATSYPGYSHRDLVLRLRMVQSLADRMMRAERLRQEGRITRAEYEARWRQVYDEMPEMDPRYGLRKCLARPRKESVNGSLFHATWTLDFAEDGAKPFRWRGV